MGKMKYSFLIIFCAIFLESGSAQNDVFLSKETIVVIDPGHGGVDSGALSRNGIAEKDITLSIAKLIQEIGKSRRDENVEIYLTRYSDTLISLSDRANLSQKLQADVFISLHCNHSINLNAKGIEVYVANTKNEILRGSILLAYTIEKYLSQNTGIRSRGVKFANFQVLRETKASASVLVELGFLSQRDEEEYLSSITGQRAIALLLFELIHKYLEAN